LRDLVPFDQPRILLGWWNRSAFLCRWLTWLRGELLPTLLEWLRGLNALRALAQVIAAELN
jgi:hypothetical protein